MMEKKLQDFNWDEISDALHTLLQHTQDEEPSAVNYIAAIEQVLAGLPENE